MYKYRISLLAASICVALIGGCGGGSNTSSFNDTTQTGVLLDSPVINIGYRTETLEGVTNALGEYKYLEGETVTFFIGDLVFPAVAAKGIVTPLDLADTLDTSNPTVVNIIRLLQTLDKDSTPDNGITITETSISGATQVDFTLSESAFATSTAVQALIANGGQDVAVTDLVSTDDAISHFESVLLENGISSGTFVGTWLATNAQDDFLQFTFFEDGTYLHAEIDFDDVDEISGMEWGTYTLNDETGELAAVTQRFDNNGDIGFTDFSVADEVIFTVSGDELTLTVDEGRNGSVDFNLNFQRISSNSLVGSWLATNAQDDFLQFTFFEDGTYLHAEIDFDDVDEISGMEWGTYTRNGETGELTAVTQSFDNNGGTGFTDFSVADEVIFTVSGDELTLTVDEGRDGSIDFNLTFQRQ